MKNLKKILSYIMTIIMTVFLFSGVNFKEASAKILEFSTGKGTFYYYISNNEVTITRYSGEDTELEIPSEINGKSVTCIGTIEDVPFTDSLQIESITIPKSVSNMGGGVFRCSDSLVNVDKDNKYFSSENGILFNKDKSELMYYPNKKNEETYTIPNSVTYISSSAFCNNCTLKSIIIPDSVTFIDSYAFSYCNLTSITILASVNRIEDFAFDGCDKLTIYANKNSSAENYAKHNSIPFKEIISSNFEISSFTASKESPQEVGKSVKLTAEVSGATGTVEYKFYRYLNKSYATIRDWSTTNNVTITPSIAGTYDIWVGAKDSTGKIVRKNISYTFKKTPKISSFKADKISPQEIGTSVKLTAEVSETTGTVQYKFYRYLNKKYATIKDWSTTNNVTIKPSIAGTYDIWVGIKDSTGKIVRKNTSFTFNAKKENPHIKLQANVEAIGWQGVVTNNEIGGTTGKSLRLEGYKLSLDTTEDLSIEYRSHVENIGWQDYVKDGELSGTENQSRRLEAISIKLSGSDANKYDVYYRVHCSYIGWLDWAKNGEDAGSTGQAIKVEAMQVVILPKGQKAPGSTENHFLSTPSVSYTVKLHNGNFGTTVKDGAMAGITGQGKQIEGIKINLNDMSLMSGSINYQGHIQYVGWGDTVSNGTALGVDGNRLEGIRIWLSESISVYYDVYYRVYCQNLGWLGWAKNGENAGSEGYSYRAEAIEIKLYRKDFGPETNEDESFKKKVPLTERQKMENRLKPIADSKSLYDCFAWVCQSTTYFRTYNFPKYHDWDIDYVNNYLDSYSNGQYYGNCYSYSAVFANLARLKGYDAELRCGYCSRVGGGLTEHCWVEINGLVYDPDMADARNNYSKYYGKTRAQIGLGYCKDVVY